MTSPMEKRPVLRSIHGAPSWRISNDVVEGWLTRLGGHLGPVHFKTPLGVVQPFSVSPWLPREVPAAAPRVLRNLRGDFFCLPFGDGGAKRGRHKHPLHGATSGGRWQLLRIAQSGDATELAARIHTHDRAGVVTKRVRLRAGQTVLYCSHEIEGVSGPMCLGHHAMLHFPDRRGAAHIAFSPIRFGQVRPSEVTPSGDLGNPSLQPGAVFRDLHRVPRKTGGYADLTRYPARKGRDDLVLVAARAARTLAWVAVTFPKERYLWFALKDPKQLASTLLWHSNGGRLSAPWKGRHRPVLGIEDVTAFFDFGLAASVTPNPLSQRGVPTMLELKSTRRLRIPYVMGIATIPKGFEAVSQVRFGAQTVTFVGDSGAAIQQAVDLSFFSEARASLTDLQ
jgi:hypothetical protein